MSGEISGESKRRAESRPKFRFSGRWFAAVVLLVVPVGFAVDRAISRGHVLGGVWVHGIALAGLDFDQVAAAISVVDRKLSVRGVRVRVQNSLFEVPPDKVGLQVDLTETARAALRAGREGSLPHQALWWLTRFAAAHHVPLRARLEEGRLDALLTEFEQATFGEVREPGIEMQGGIPMPIFARSALRVDLPRARAAVLKAFQAEDAALVPLPLVEQEPRVDRASVEALVTQAKEVVSAPVFFRGADGLEALRITGRELGAALKSQLGSDGKPALALNATFLAQALGERLTVLERAPLDATFVVDAARRVRVEPSRPGFRPQGVEFGRRALAAALSKERAAAVPYEPVLPRLATEQARELGITKFLGQFTTRFQCCEPRVKNIERMAALLDGVVVMPAHTFSLNEYVGERTQKSGFVLAPSIADGEMVETIGGGVSQFATTFFNAVLHAGLAIVERQPHTLWFPRYPMGHEATLSWPKPDLVFQNDTRAGLLIKTRHGRTHISVELYGNNGGRLVRVAVSPRRDIVEPGVDLVADETVPPDEERVRTSGVMGWTVTASRTTRFADRSERVEKRDVVYSPRRRILLVHPCRIPKGDEGYTGKPCPEPEDVELPEEPQGGDALGATTDDDASAKDSGAEG